LEVLNKTVGDSNNIRGLALFLSTNKINQGERKATFQFHIEKKLQRKFKRNSIFY
jgi:hypothetical protein